MKNPIILKGGSDPNTSARLILAMMSPKKCGYDGIDFSNGIAAGTLFAICFWAITGKVASPKTCIKLNHFQNDLMQNSLRKVGQLLN